MNFVAACLVFHSSSSFEALRVFYYLMWVKGYRRLFLGELDFGKKLAGRLAGEVRRLVYDLYCHLVLIRLSRWKKASNWSSLLKAGTSRFAAVSHR